MIVMIRCSFRANWRQISRQIWWIAEILWPSFRSLGPCFSVFLDFGVYLRRGFRRLWPPGLILRRFVCVSLRRIIR